MEGSDPPGEPRPSGQHARDVLAPISTIAAVLVGGAITYYASRQLQVSQAHDAARGPARVLQEDYRERLNTVYRFVDDKDSPRELRRDIGRIQSPLIDLSPADRKLIAASLDADNWRRIVDASTAYRIFRFDCSRQRQRLVRNESVDTDTVAIQAATTSIALQEG